MAFIIDGKKRIPFMRGMLVHHLIQRGFDHDEAYQLADEVRGELGERKSVSRDEILELLGNILVRDHADQPVGDLVFWERAPTAIRVTRKSGSRPFSKELLSHSIQASGLPPEAAYALAQNVESRLVQERNTDIDHEHLETVVEDVLSETHGRNYAQRYRVWRAWGNLDKPLIILIGGASGVGKTTLAISLANLLDIPRVVATDDIRQILRLTLAEDFMPAIHTSSYRASEAIPESSQVGQDPVIAGYREQARVVGVGVRAIISRCIEENTSVIMDGVHLLPGFIDLSAFEKKAIIAPVSLIVSERQAYEERFDKRAALEPARESHKYLEHLDRILAIQEHILQCSEREDVPIIDVTALEDPSSAAVTLVAERLQKEKEIRKVMGGNGKAKKKG
ncbi:MAG: ATP cone domain-containing protein [Candidatus Latescibacterota bacterium]|nr:ATP cone domain-containing protein [Candidatus Latescibacterota bacterium]